MQDYENNDIWFKKEGKIMVNDLISHLIDSSTSFGEKTLNATKKLKQNLEHKKIFNKSSHISDINHYSENPDKKFS